MKKLKNSGAFERFTESEFLQKFKDNRILTIMLCVLMAIFTISISTFAFFKTNLSRNGFANVKIELIFDKLSSAAPQGGGLSPLDAYQATFVDKDGNNILKGTKEGAGGTGDYEWGHKGNPYVISAKNHLLNLSTLQNIGYFYEKFIKSNYSTLPGGIANPAEKGVLKDPQAEYSDGYNVPYFLVSKADGTPATIDASRETIRAVGNDEFPFIGVVSGAGGAGDASAPTTQVCGKASKTSAIYGATIKTSGSELDVGFFGRISYLGNSADLVTPPGGNAELDKGFKGFVSGISNILFADIKVVVVNTIWDKIANIFNNHIFHKDLSAQGGQTPDAGKPDPHETHHIGIVAGHIEYARAKDISIYYSANHIKAMDIKDGGTVNGSFPNYSSATGYFGFLNNLNPIVVDGYVTPESGLSDSQIHSGMGGGGGLLSGNSPGYIRADEMYKLYNYYSTDADPNTIDQERPLKVIKARMAKADDKGNHPPLVNEVSNVTSTCYYFTDGVFTFALSEGQTDSYGNTIDEKCDTIENIWGVDSSTVDQIRLANAWEIEQNVKEKRYEKKLFKITDKADLDTRLKDKNARFYFGNETAQGNYSIFQFLNLTFEQTSRGEQIPAVLASGILKESAHTDSQGNIVLSYTSIADRTKDSKYGVKLTRKKGKKNNPDTYTLHNGDPNSTLKLGFTDGLVSHALVVTDKNSLPGLFGSLTPVSVKYNFQMKYCDIKNPDSGSLSSNAADNGWLLTNSGYDIGFNGTAFKVGFFTSAVPIQIYYDNGDDDRVIYEDSYTYNPAANSNQLTLPADSYVFMPQQYYTRESKGNTTYEIKSLVDLGWTDNNGQPIWAPGSENGTSIKKMFDIKQAVQWGIALDIGGFGLGVGSKGGIMSAPVGGGKKAYLPTGSVGFRINKVPAGGAKIRVIVKAPSTKKLREFGLDGNPNNPDYFVGIWQGKDKSNSIIQASSFNVDNAYQKVEMPRSQPLISGLTENHEQDADGYSTKDEAIDVVYKGTNYKTYLQGGSYLVAYEFNVQTTGLFILAASKSNMQIAYLAVDGVASAGNDGTGSEIFGNVDFVYSNNTNVLLVTDRDTREPTGGSYPERDYNAYFYSTNLNIRFDSAKAFTDNKGVNMEDLSVYRTCTDPPPAGSIIQGTLHIIGTDNYILCDIIGEPHDNIDIQYGAVPAPPSPTP